MRSVLKILFNLSVVILFLISIGFLIMAFKDRSSADYMIGFLECFMGAIVLAGFSVIVDAAFLYREKIEAEE